MDKLYFICALLFFYMTIFLILTAYHNIDMAYNNADNLNDINPFGVIKIKDQVYLSGLGCLLLACFSSLLEFIFLFLSF